MSAASLCYICCEPSRTVTNPLVCPCKCKTQCVHPTCLQAWALSRPKGKTGEKGMTCCEVCHSPYWGRPVCCYVVMVVVWVVHMGNQLLGQLVA